MYASLEAIRRDLADIRAEQARNASAVCEVAESVSSVVERVKVVEMEMGRLTVAAESLRNFQATTPAPVRTPMAAPGSVTPGFELEVMRRSGVAEVAGSVWHSTGQARHAGRVHYPACSFAPTFDAAVLESAGELYFALQDEKDAPVRVFLRVD